MGTPKKDVTDSLTGILLKLGKPDKLNIPEISSELLRVKHLIDSHWNISPALKPDKELQLDKDDPQKDKLNRRKNDIPRLKPPHDSPPSPNDWMKV